MDIVQACFFFSAAAIMLNKMIRCKMKTFIHNVFQSLSVSVTMTVKVVAIRKV